MNISQKLLNGKIGVVFGIANHRSIGWAIAKAWNEAGATIVLGYQNERLEENVKELAQQLVPPALIVKCDVTDDEQINRAFDQIKSQCRRIDMLAHSIAFAQRRALQGKFIDITREDFLESMNISVYSFIALVQKAVPLMTNGGAILTLTYYGSTKVVPNYNVMGIAKAALESTVRYLAADLGPLGIRVNAISAGPIKTIAASGISGFSQILKIYEEKSPLRRNVRAEEIGSTAVFLSSEGAGAITGQIVYVDCGYEIMGI